MATTGMDILFSMNANDSRIAKQCNIDLSESFLSKNSFYRQMLIEFKVNKEKGTQRCGGA